MNTENLEVLFTTQIDSENFGINVFHNRNMIASGQLNICKNWAHVNILEHSKQAFENMEHEIERAIERRDLVGNRIGNGI